MASREELLDSLRNFEELCNRNEELKKMNRTWNRTVLVRASDTGDQFSIRMQDGDVTVAGERPEGYDLEVIADSDTLSAMFYGEVTPTDPYLNGTLAVKGAEDDLLRLDFITAMIWDE